MTDEEKVVDSDGKPSESSKSAVSSKKPDDAAEPSATNDAKPVNGEQKLADAQSSDTSDPPKKVVADDDDDEAPLSMRDVELDPVSLHDLELILAPGRAPPTLAAPPAPPPLPPAAGAPAPARVVDIPAPQGKTLPRAPARRESSPPPPPDSGLTDLRAMVQAAEPLLRPASVNFDDIMEIGTAGPIVKSTSLVGPDLATLSTKPSGEAPKARPRPPLKKRPDAAAPAAEPAGDEAIPDATPSVRAKAKVSKSSVDAPPSSRGARRKKKKPGSLHADPEALFAYPADPPPMPIEPPAELEAPASEPEPEAESKPEPKPKSKAKPHAKAAPAPVEKPKEEPAKSRAFLYVIGAVVLVLVGYFMPRGGDAPTDKPEPKPSPTGAAQGPQTQTPTGAPTLATTPAPTADTTASTAPTASADAATSASAKPTASPSAIAATGTPTATPTTTATTAATTTATTTAAPTASAPPPTPTVEAGGAEFDKGAASAALAAAAGQAAGCKQEGDPSGTASAQITFAPSGRVTSANISGPPFAGTATGGCIARALKSAKVPPFSGAPVTVSKTVTIR